MGFTEFTCAKTDRISGMFLTQRKSLFIKRQDYKKHIELLDYMIETDRANWTEFKFIKQAFEEYIRDESWDEL